MSLAVAGESSLKFALPGGMGTPSLEDPKSHCSLSRISFPFSPLAGEGWE